jgi:hypothetical protein
MNYKQNVHSNESLQSKHLCNTMAGVSTLLAPLGSPSPPVCPHILGSTC